MEVVLVFEPASDAHWMKDVVQFPNAISQLKNNSYATLITRPNHKQTELAKHIKISYLGQIIESNYSNFEYSDFTPSRLKTEKEWFLKGCEEAANIGDTLIVYPWYGDCLKGSRIFKIRRWLKLRRANVILKTDGILHATAHEHPGYRKKIREYIKFYFVDKIICENLDTYELYIKNHPHLASKIIYIPNCPLDIYFAGKNPALNRRPHNFLFVGRICSPQKGADILLEQWLKMFTKISDWKLTLVGPCSPEFKKEWVIKLKSAGAEDSINWHGAATPNELLLHYSNARTVVCTSRDDSGPIVLSEAALSGCAFIGTAVGEIPFILKDLPGLVRDVEKLGEEMLYFALNEEVVRNQAIVLREKMKDRKWSEQVKKIGLNSGK